MHMNEELLSILGGEKEDEKEECSYLFGKVRSISDLMKTFPDVIERVLLKVRYYDEHKDELEEREIKIQEQQMEEENGAANDNANGKNASSIVMPRKVVTFDNGKRLLFWGQYLKKTIVG